MTKENNNNIEQIKDLLLIWESKKQDRKATNDFFKLENKIAFIDKINQKCLNSFIKARDKNGFMLIFKKDIFKYFLKAFYENNGVFFIEQGEQLKVVYENQDDLLKCSDFKKYAFAKIDENKQKERDKKEKLTKVKTGVQFNKMTSEQLQAVILQARQALKTTKE